ncbi:MAG TPA: hypothetical protein VGX03_18345 [Candidatus Binatia bacterium]|jgi:hypothetical protein|nr:hypothetical protein [Candidatus Binatia bacterium]
MFEPDIMLPEQFAALQRKPLQREKRLLLALVEDAVQCFQTYLFAQRLQERGLFQEAEEWINCTDSEWFCSFENVCELLGFHPAYLRDALNQWKAEQLLLHSQRGQERQYAKTRDAKCMTVRCETSL